MFGKKPRTTRTLIVIAIFLGIFLALNPANQVAEAPEALDALSYDLTAPVTMHPTKVNFIPGFETAASICGTNEDFERYVETFKPLNGQEVGFYSFHYEEEALEGWDFQVFLHPNVVGYEDFEAFKAAYTICGIEEVKIPYAMNEKWVMLINTCEEDELTSENCMKAKEAVESSLKLTMGDLPENTEPLKYFDAEDQAENDSEEGQNSSSEEGADEAEPEISSNDEEDETVSEELRGDDETETSVDPNDETDSNQESEGEEGE